MEAADFCAVWADECGLAAGDGDRAGGEAESVGGEEALLEAVAAPEIPDLVRARAAPRAVVDGLVRQRLDLGERGIARDWAAFERRLCERGRLGRGQVVRRIGRERGGAVGLPQRFEAVAYFGVSHLRRERERLVGRRELDALRVGEARDDEAAVDGVFRRREERAQTLREMRVDVRRDGRLRVEEVYVACRVGDDGDALVLQRAARLLRYDGPVRPHGARDEAAVVRQNPRVRVDEILRVKRRRHQVDALERQTAHDERRRRV